MSKDCQGIGNSAAVGMNFQHHGENRENKIERIRQPSIGPSRRTATSRHDRCGATEQEAHRRHFDHLYLTEMFHHSRGKRMSGYGLAIDSIVRRKCDGLVPPDYFGGCRNDCCKAAGMSCCSVAEEIMPGRAD
jgi:hypothetical protein